MVKMFIDGYAPAHYAPAPAPKPAAAPPPPVHHEDSFLPTLENLFGGAKPKEHADHGLAVVDSGALLNSIAERNELTTGFKTAHAANHLAENARAMGNESFAQKFENVADQRAGRVNAFFESPAFEVADRAAGGVLGGLSIAQGVGEWQAGNKTQGGFDAVAGGLGMAAAVNPELAPVALGAALAASGNAQTQKWGWWGKNADGTNKDSVQWTMDNTSNAFNRDLNATKGTYNTVDNALGGGVLGHIGGGLAAAPVALNGALDTGLTALGSGTVALGGDLVGGVASVATGLGGLAKDAGSGLAHLGGSVVSSIADHLPW